MRKRKATKKDIQGFNNLKMIIDQFPEKIRIDDLKKFPDEFYVKIYIAYRKSNFLQNKSGLENILKQEGIKFRSPFESKAEFNSDWSTYRVVYKIRVNQLSLFLQKFKEIDGEGLGLFKDFRGFSGSSLEEPKHEYFANVISNLLMNANHRLEMIKRDRLYIPEEFSRLDCDFNYGNFRY